MPDSELVRTSALLDQSNPAGLAAGSRWAFMGIRGNDRRTREPKLLASRRDASKTNAFQGESEDKLIRISDWHSWLIREICLKHPAAAQPRGKSHRQRSTNSSTRESRVPASMSAHTTSAGPHS